MRSLRDPGFYVIGAAMLCGIVGVPAVLAIPAAVVGLQALTIGKHLGLHDRAQRAGAGHVWWRTVSLSVVLAVIISGGAYVCGKLAAMAWGVM